MKPKQEIMPRGLSDAAQTLWKKLLATYDIGTDDVEGVLLVEAVCRASMTMAEAQKQLDKDGLIVDGKLGKKAHPCVSILRDARNSYLKALHDLHLDEDPPRPAHRPARKFT